MYERSSEKKGAGMSIQAWMIRLYAGNREDEGLATAKFTEATHPDTLKAEI
jgi:hypothetical protein